MTGAAAAEYVPTTRAISSPSSGGVYAMAGDGDDERKEGRNCSGLLIAVREEGREASIYSIRVRDNRVLIDVRQGYGLILLGACDCDSPIDVRE